MSRERQRANHKLKVYANAHGGKLPEGVDFDRGKKPVERTNARCEKPWLNHEGYHDPTAYQAIRNAERSRR